MAINEQQIINVSKLAKIHLGQEELSHFKDDLSAILDFVKQIQEVNTDNIPPMASPLTNNQPLRTDKVTESDCLKQAQALTQHMEAQLYRVPKVIE